MIQFRRFYKEVLPHTSKILNGVFNYFFGSRIRRRQRMAICTGCEYYDQKGEGEKVVLKGKPACSICGCNVKLLTSCTDCVCSREDIGLTPLW